ncbi:LysE family translocator [Zavarzinia sp. CC-PAN008]|uniref:LysE family translocator n=1 Tax=Zavarzinia sp. CC-PAN008 TaxID=3243332 RepID=UPI003F746851
MSLESVIIYALALGLAAASPGPGVVGIVARTLGFGLNAGLMMSLGLIVSDLIYLMASLFGLALLASQMGELFMVVKVLGGLYLAWLGWQLWRAPAHAIADTPVLREAPWRSFLSGLTLSLGNPKAMAFYLALLPTIVDTSHPTALAAFELAIATILVLLVVTWTYAFAAVRVRRLLVNARAVRILNRSAGAALIGAGAAVAAS